MKKFVESKTNQQKIYDNIYLKRKHRKTLSNF